MDCSKSLSLRKGQKSDYDFKFNKTGNSTVISDIFSDFFINKEPNCKINKCEILQQDCIKNLSSNQSQLIKLNRFNIAIKQNLQNGWSESICVKCENGLSEVKKTPMRIT